LEVKTDWFKNSTQNIPFFHICRKKTQNTLVYRGVTRLLFRGAKIHYFKIFGGQYKGSLRGQLPNTPPPPVDASDSLCINETENIF